MKDQFKEILYQVATETLETLAFIFSFPEDERDNINYDSAVAASVSFTGPFSGTLILAVSDQILPGIAEDMLGIEEEISLSQQHDALKEILNVICGNLLPTIAGKRKIFNINVPKIIVREENIEFVDKRKPTSTAKLELENGQADLYLFIDGGDKKE